MPKPGVDPSATSCPPAPASSTAPWQQEDPSPTDAWFRRSSDRDAQLLTHALASQLRSHTPASNDPHPAASSVPSHPPWAADPHAVLRAWQHNATLSQLQPSSGSSLSSPDMPGSPFHVSGSSNNNYFTSGQSHLSMEPENNNMGSFQSSLSGFVPIKLEESASTPGANGTNNSLSSSLRSGAISAQAAVGAVSTKVSKRRSRANNKPPITVLSADTSNFRDMVQKLTGIPPSPSLQRNRFQLWSTPSGVSVLKPHPTRPSQNMNNLPTLDTSSAFLLLDGGSSLAEASRLFQDGNFLQSPPSLSFLQSSQPLNDASFPANLVSEIAMNRVASQLHQAAFASAATIDLKSLLTNHFDPSKQDDPNDQNNSTGPAFWDPTEGKECDRTRERLFAEMLQESLGRVSNPVINGSSNQVAQAMSEGELFNRRQNTSLESLLMGNDRVDVDFPSRTLHTVDSWLSCDGIHAVPSKMELAHSA